VKGVSPENERIPKADTFQAGAGSILAAAMARLQELGRVVAHGKLPQGVKGNSGEPESFLGRLALSSL
jgi:hypothetical protein